MSINRAVTNTIEDFPPGKPFATSAFFKLGSRAAIDKTLSRLAKQGTIERLTQGIYVRPKKNRFVGSVHPPMNEIIETIARSNGETIQTHGSVAVNHFQLSTQVPTQPSYYTSGSSRTLTIGKLKVRLIHAAPRKLQLAGKRSGLALSALWYLGKEETTAKTVNQIMAKLTKTEQQELHEAEKPEWMQAVFSHQHHLEVA